LRAYFVCLTFVKHKLQKICNVATFSVAYKQFFIHDLCPYGHSKFQMATSSHSVVRNFPSVLCFYITTNC